MAKKLTIEEIKQIKEIAEKYEDKYGVVAIRTQTVPFKLGEIEHESSVWEDNIEMGERLVGICATNITNNYGMEEHFYEGEYQAIIVGDRFEYGNDLGEVIIQDPIVVEIIEWQTVRMGRLTSSARED